MAVATATYVTLFVGGLFVVSQFSTYVMQRRTKPYDKNRWRKMLSIDCWRIPHLDVRPASARHKIVNYSATIFVKGNVLIKSIGLLDTIALMSPFRGSI